MDGTRISLTFSRRVVTSGAALLVIGCWLIVNPLLAQDAAATAKEAEAKPVQAKAAKPADKPDDKKDATKDDTAKDAAEKKKPPANPLADLIRGVFGGKKKADRPPVGDLIPANPNAPEGTKKLIGNGDTTARDHIDTRAPYDMQQASRLRKAEALIKNGHYPQAAEWLQRVLDKVDDVDDSVIRLPNGQLVSVSTQASRLLGKFPPEALKAYRLQHGDVARQQLAEALSKSDTRGIAEVADKYFHTDAGHEAANYLGTQHTDRGEFGPAARRFLQLIEADAAVTKTPQWKLKAAVVFREAGMGESLKQVRQQLADPAASSLLVGGKSVEPASWLDSLGEVAHLVAPHLDEWLMLYGTPQRTGVAVGGDPLLLQRWSTPLTHNRKITGQIAILLEDLADQNRAAISAWHPITVGDKVIFRTLRGVQVVDADTGTPLWETRSGISPEQLLAGQPTQTYNGRNIAFGGFGFRNGMLSNYRSNSVDHHPLTSLLFRNGTFGMLSSHQGKLFVIEDHAVLSQQQPGSYGGRNLSQNDPYRRDWSSNKLTGYDLEDGRPVWEVGGQDTKESIQLPLAGTYFFGAPTPAGRELLVVGEKDNEIRLFSLDPNTGQPNWSQLLAVSESRIDEDLGRRWWPAQVAVSGGVIVCPTTLGWLVGVDRTSHNILWTHRYSPRQRKRGRNFGGRQTSVVQNSTYGQRWCPSAPMIVGDRVIYTPSEYTGELNSAQTSIVCVNLSDGKRLWQQAKGNYRYLAGVFNNKPLLVGTSSISALSLEKGQVLWTRSIPQADGHPSGFGVAVEDRYHLPLSSGQLWTIDLKDGRPISKSYLADEPGRLGNLTLHRGMLLSLSPLGLTSFEQREAIVAEIARRKAKDPQDTWALLRQADIHVLNREYEPALAVLRDVPREKLDSNNQPHYRKQMIACLTNLIRADFAKRSAEVAELNQFAEQPEEKLHARRLAAEQHESLKEYRAAFIIYQSLAASVDDQIVDGEGKSKIKLPIDRWLTGRMGDLWRVMNEETRNEVGAEIVKQADTLGDDPAAWEQFVTRYNFHPLARTIRLQLAERYAATGEISRAQFHLLQLTHAADETVAADAVQRLAQLMQNRKLNKDAEYYYRQLATRHPDVKLQDGTTAAALVEKLQADGVIQDDKKRDRQSWGDFDLKIERTGSNYSSSQQYELKSGEFRLPFFSQFRFEIDSQQKLSIVNLSDGTMHWLVPLRGKPNSSQSYPVAEAVGHRLFVLYRDVIHCLSPVERKVEWTRTLETRGQANGYYYYPNQQSARPMQSGQSILSGQALVQQNSKTGMLAVANSNYVCVYGRRKFTVLDSATGKVRWMCRNVPAYTKLVGNEDVLYMVPKNRADAVAYRAADGKPLAVENVGSLMGKAIRISERGLVLIEQRSGSSILGLSTSSATVVRQFDPLTKTQHWTHSFPSGVYFSVLEGDTLAALRKDGTFAVLDMESGKLSELGKLESDEAKSRSGMYVVADHDNVYVIANKSRRSGSYYSLGLPFVRVNGAVIAFDRVNGKRLWKQTVENQNLVRSQFEHSPVMTFAMRTYVRKGALNYWTLSVVALDKSSGRKLVESKSPFNSSFRSVDVNLADRYIELRSYNDRFRLVAVDRKEAKVSSPESGD